MSGAGKSILHSCKPAGRRANISHGLRPLQVKEINELRFVLCPKRMNDAQFWIVYFSLARKSMPAEAFDPGFKVPQDGRDGDSQRRFMDLQAGIKKTFETARQTANKWRDRATNTLQPAGWLSHFQSFCSKEPCQV